MNPTLQVRVLRKSIEALDVCSFELADAQGRDLPGFSAGSHVDVHLPNGLVRQYSLCNDPAENHRYLIAVLKDPRTRGGSPALHDQVHEGDLLAISAPKNHFPLAHGATRSILLGGGIGITPILCMAERLAAAGEDFELHYCARSKDRAAFVGRIAQASFAARTQLHFDDGAAEQKLDLGALFAAPQAGVHVYVCGPTGFMDAVIQTAQRRGWPEAQIHREYFAAEPLRADSDGCFEVQLASSGRVVVVEEEQSVVQALDAAGVSVATSCEQGVCGSCLTRVLDGVPDHRDMFLTTSEQAANDQFLPCCSRAKSARLVLDL